MLTPWFGRAVGWVTVSSCKMGRWWARTASDSPRKMAADGIKSRRAALVLLGDRVEVQANSCVDRASVGDTEIASGVKIDNLVQVGHGSTVGENTLLCAQVGLAGSSGVGKNVAACRTGGGGRP